MKLEIELSDSLVDWLSETAQRNGVNLEMCFLEVLQQHVDSMRDMTSPETQESSNPTTNKSAKSKSPSVTKNTPS